MTTPGLKYLVEFFTTSAAATNWLNEVANQGYQVARASAESATPETEGGLWVIVERPDPQTGHGGF